MATAWFTFGQSHVHSINGRTFDKDTVVEITADDPAERMFFLFGDKWSIQYNERPKLRHEGGWFDEIVDMSV
jgi:hypothetical protein